MNPRLQNVCDYLRVKPTFCTEIHLIYENNEAFVKLNCPDVQPDFTVQDFCELATFFLQKLFTIGSDDHSVYVNHRKVIAMDMEFPSDIARITYEDISEAEYFGKFHSDMLRNRLRVEDEAY